MAKVVGVVKMLLTDENGKVINLGQALDTTTAWLETKDLDFGATHIKKFFEGLVADFHTVSPGSLDNMSYMLGVRDRLGESVPITWYGPYPLVDAEVNWFPQEVESTRYLRLRFTDTGIREIWKLGGLRILGVGDGGAL